MKNAAITMIALALAGCADTATTTQHKAALAADDVRMAQAFKVLGQSIDRTQWALAHGYHLVYDGEGFEVSQICAGGAIYVTPTSHLERDK